MRYLLFLLVLLPALAAPPDQTFEGPGYTLTHPADWTATPDGPTNGVGTLKKGDATIHLIHSDFFLKTKPDWGMVGPEAFRSGSGTVYPIPSVPAAKPFKVGTIEGLAITFTTPEVKNPYPRPEQKHLQVWIPGWQFTLAAKKTDFAPAKSVFQRVLATLTFTRP